MIEINATEFKNNLGQYLQKVYKEPVIVHKTGRPTAVLLSYEEYMKLSKASQQQAQGRYEPKKEQALQKIRNEFKKLHMKNEGL